MGARCAWSELIQTKGSSDLYVQENTWQPGGSTGWHTHPDPSFVIVTEGSVTVYDGGDPTCAGHVYTAGTANNSFVDAGGGHVHIIRNETGSVAKTIAVMGDPRRCGQAPGTQPTRETAPSDGCMRRRRAGGETPSASPRACSRPGSSRSE